MSEEMVRIICRFFLLLALIIVGGLILRDHFEVFRGLVPVLTITVSAVVLLLVSRLIFRG